MATATATATVTATAMEGWMAPQQLARAGWTRRWGAGTVQTGSVKGCCRLIPLPPGLVTGCCRLLLQAPGRWALLLAAAWRLAPRVRQDSAKRLLLLLRPHRVLLLPPPPLLPLLLRLQLPGLVWAPAGLQLQAAWLALLLAAAC
jgi:hypothetical protein